MRFSTLQEYGLQEMAFRCAQCSFCQVGNGACPTYKVKRVDSYSGKGKMLLTRALLQKRIKPSEGLTGLRDAVFGCTLCGGCEEVCQVNIPFVKLYQTMRADFFKAGMWPEQLKTARETLLKSYNVQGQSQMDRVEGWSYWHPDEDALLSRVGRRAKTAFFFGCASSYRAVPIQATIATTLIMDRVEEDYTVLGDQEWCCGAPMIMAGDFETARLFAEHNIAKYRELGVERLVTNCPGCYRMWKEEYHEFLDIDVPFEVIYGAQYYADLIDRGRISGLTSPLDVSVTFHDGCDAGRNSGIYEEPRKVLENLPGVTFEELPHTKNKSFCCGSGGVLRAFDPDFSVKINRLKVEDIEATSAQVVATACPSCVDFMHEQLPQTGSSKQVKDLAVLVAQALGLKWDGLDEIY
ncbi:MAG: (Fe-S)-binding protein [Candidatus Thorarchaeota archaeon]|nr:(Fe-S)-binding protein [Candidatus Thorarchaeota archaeon]